MMKSRLRPSRLYKCVRFSSVAVEGTFFPPFGACVCFGCCCFCPPAVQIPQRILFFSRRFSLCISACSSCPVTFVMLISMPIAASPESSQTSCVPRASVIRSLWVFPGQPCSDVGDHVHANIRGVRRTSHADKYHFK